MAQDNIIQVENLVKIYPGDVKALSGIDFNVGRGEFFGFLGPNGAGKSTTQLLENVLVTVVVQIGEHYGVPFLEMAKTAGSGGLESLASSE